MHPADVVQTIVFSVLIPWTISKSSLLNQDCDLFPGAGVPNGFEIHGKGQKVHKLMSHRKYVPSPTLEDRAWVEADLGGQMACQSQRVWDLQRTHLEDQTSLPV